MNFRAGRSRRRRGFAAAAPPGNPEEEGGGKGQTASPLHRLDAVGQSQQDFQLVVMDALVDTVLQRLTPPRPPSFASHYLVATSTRSNSISTAGTSPLGDKPPPLNPVHSQCHDPTVHEEEDWQSGRELSSPLAAAHSLPQLHRLYCLRSRVRASESLAER